MNEKIVAIHQPNFMPWLGYFHKMSMVDEFVLFDDVQVPQGKSFASRVMLKTHTGPVWVTVPTLHRSAKEDFRTTPILQSNWQSKSLKTIRLAYQKAPYFEQYFTRFSEIYLRPYATLFDLNFQLLQFLKESFGLRAQLVISSSLGGTDLGGVEKILWILEALGATTYVSGKGAGSRRYINEQDFADRNIRLVWQDFTPHEYPQLHGSFVPRLSALDYLLNCGGNPFESVQH